jgi:O-antigen ligase
MATLTRIVLLTLVAYTGYSIAVNAEGAVLPFSVGPLNIYAFDVLLLAAVVLLLREATLRDGQPIPSANRVVIALVLGYCAYQVAVVLPIAVVFHGLDPIAVARQLTQRVALVMIPFVYLAGMKYVSPQRIVSWVNVAAVCVAFYALYTYATVGIVGWQDSGAFRIRLVWTGATMLFGFLILTSLFLRRPTVFGYLLALLGLIGMGLTNVRSGYLALIVTVPPLLLNVRLLGRRAAVILLVCASAAVLLFTVSPAARDSVMYSLRTMVNPSADKSTHARLDRSKLGWDYFVANPLGDYVWSGRYYLVDVGPDAFEPHSFVIQLLGQQGIVGFTLFASIIIATARIGWGNRRSDPMSAVMLAYLAFYLLFCLFNTNLLNISNIALLSLPVALILWRNARLAAEASGEQPSMVDVGRDRQLPSAMAAQ